MIDIEREHCFRLTEAPKHVPLRNGRRVHVSTLFRWAQRGVRGCKLEAIRIGGALHTSQQALQRFAEQLTAGDQDDVTREDTTAAAANRQAAEAEAELERIGI